MFERWGLIEGQPGDFCFSELINKSNALIILFRKFGSQDEFLRVEFSGVLTYRYTIESARMKTINENNSLGVLNKATSSTYLSWFKDESAGMFDSMELMHILICGFDCIIETITNEVPQVSWIRN